MKKSVVELKSDTALVIKTNGAKSITGSKDQAIRNESYDSFLNLVDGGLVVDQETGYSTDIIITDDKAFTPKKYVDDALSNVDISSFGNKTAGVIGDGCEVTINADPSKIDISAGKYRITDYWSVPGTQTDYEVTYAGVTGLAVTYLATNTQSYIYLKQDGTVHQSETKLSRSNERDYVALAVLGHSNLTSVASVIPMYDQSESPIEQLYDLFEAIDIINTGNAIAANGANLSIDKEVGYLFGKGLNKDFSIKEPHRRLMSTQVLASLRERTQTGAGSTVTVISNGFYDNAGTKTAISGSGNRATNMRFYLFPSGNIAYQLGQTIYNSLNEAIIAYPTESFVEYENISNEAILIGAISVTKGCTALNDTATAKFHGGQKIKGITSIGAGGSIIPYTPLDAAGSVIVTGDQNFGGKSINNLKSIDLGSDATGDIYYRDSGGNLVRLAAGTNGHVLTISTGLPVWAAVSAGDVFLSANQTFTGRNTFSNTNTDVRTLNVWDGTGYVQGLTGSSVFLTVGGGTYTSLLIPATVQPSAGGNLTIRCQTGGSVLALRHIGGSTANWVEVGGTNVGSMTSGTGYNIKIVGGYVVASGTAVYNLVSEENTINQTGGTGVVNGFKIAPLLTSVTGQFRGYSTNLTATPTGGGVAYAQYHEGTAASVFGGALKFIDSTLKDFVTSPSSGVISFGSGFSTTRLPILAGTGNRKVWANSNGDVTATDRSTTIASSATPSINTDTTTFFSITALAVDITSFTTNLTGTPSVNQILKVDITGTATRSITWGASFEDSTELLPTTTVGTNRLDVILQWNSVTSKWRCLGVR